MPLLLTAITFVPSLSSQQRTRVIDKKNSLLVPFSRLINILYLPRRIWLDQPEPIKMSAESRILCRVKGSTKRFRIVCFHPSCSFDHLLQKVATALQVVPPVGTLLLAAGAEEDDTPAIIESMEHLREGDRCIFVPTSNVNKKKSPHIIDVDEILDIDNEPRPPLAPMAMAVKSEGVSQVSSEAMDYVEQPDDDPLPEIIDVDETIDVDIEPSLAPIIVTSNCISQGSSKAVHSVEQAGLTPPSPEIIDVDEAIDVDIEPSLAPIIVTSNCISQGSSKAVYSVEQAGVTPPSPEMIDADEAIDVDIEPSLAPVVVKSEGRSQRSILGAGDKAINHKVKSEETLPSAEAKMEDSPEAEESKEDIAKVESMSGSGSSSSSQAPPKVGSRFFYRHGGNLYPVVLFRYQHGRHDTHGREMKTDACYIRYAGIKGKAWEGYRLPILVKVSTLLDHTEERERRYKRRMRLQMMAARNHNTHEKGEAEEYANGADKHGVEQDGGQSCTKVGGESKDQASIGPYEERSADNEDRRKSRKQAPSNIEQSVATGDSSGEEETEKDTEEQTFEAESEVQKARRQSRRIADRKSCTDASGKNKRRVESSAGASEKRSSNQKLPKIGTPLFYNLNGDLYPVVVCEEPTKKANQRRPHEGECYVRHTSPIGMLAWIGYKRHACVKVDRLAAYTKEREEKYNKRMMHQQSIQVKLRNTLWVRQTSVQDRLKRERAHQEAENKRAATARQVELAEKNKQLRMERLGEKRQAEQEKESRKRQRKDREEKYHTRMVHQQPKQVTPRNSLRVKHAGVQDRQKRERAHQEEAENKRVATARQVELAEKNKQLAEKNKQLRMERRCKKRQAEQEKESRKRQRVEKGKRREEELDMLYGPPTDASCLVELWEDNQVEGRILEEPEKNRFVYFAFDNDTAQDIASKFEINVEKIIYDNTKATKLLTKVRKLLAFTPIIIPIRWGGSIYKNPSHVKQKAIIKHGRTSLVEDFVAVTPGYRYGKLLLPVQQANIVSPAQDERPPHGRHGHEPPEVEMMYG
jgi:hypothetical protein